MLGGSCSLDFGRFLDRIERFELLQIFIFLHAEITEGLGLGLFRRNLFGMLNLVLGFFLFLNFVVGLNLRGFQAHGVQIVVDLLHLSFGQCRICQQRMQQVI